MASLDDILLAISGLGTRLDKMDTRFDKIESLLDKIESRLDKMDARLDKMDARLDKMDARLDKMDARLDKMDARLDKIESRLSEVESWQKSQPDMRLMLANSKVILERLVHIESEIVMLRAAVNDHARENVTPGEMAAIHQDLAKLRMEQMDGEARMRRVESVLELPRV